MSSTNGVFDNKPFETSLYNLYDKYLEDPTQCPKCHSGTLYRDVCNCKHLGSSTEANVCLMCGWRFELVPRVTEIPSDEKELDELDDLPVRYVNSSTPSCQVEGCEDPTHPNSSGLCAKHCADMRRWRDTIRNSPLVPPPFISVPGGTMIINPERIAYENSSSYNGYRKCATSIIRRKGSDAR